MYSSFSEYAALSLLRNEHSLMKCCLVSGLALHSLQVCHLKSMSNRKSNQHSLVGCYYFALGTYVYNSVLSWYQISLLKSGYKKQIFVKNTVGQAPDSMIVGLILLECFSMVIHCIS